MENDKIVFIPIKHSTMKTLQQFFKSKEFSIDSFDAFLNQVINYGLTIEELHRAGKIDANILDDITNVNLINSKEVFLN